MLLQKIFEKLQQDTQFLKTYEVREITNEPYSNNPIIIVKRKEPPIEKLTIYDPDMKLVNLQVRYYYKIYCVNAIMCDQLCINPVCDTQSRQFVDYYRYKSSPKSAKPYSEMAFFGQFDIKKITSYIENTEYDLMFENNNADNVVAYNTIWPVWSGKKF